MCRNATVALVSQWTSVFVRLSCSPFDCLSCPQADNATCSLAGRELDLRRFHEAIEEYGGFDAAVSNKKFGRIAVKLGIDLAVATNAAYLLKYALSCLLNCFLGVSLSMYDAMLGRQWATYPAGFTISGYWRLTRK